MSRLNRLVAVCAGGVLLAGAVLLRAQVATPSAPPQTVDFTRDIEPIFRRYCYECHGPAGETNGDLRLYSPDLIRAGGASGPVIAPGKSGDSYLIHRILGIGGEDKMPMDRDPLPEATLALLRAWIDQGAAMPAAAPATAIAAVESSLNRHWAYVAPTRPDLPPVANAGWAQNPIDRFVLARLERERLSPSADAVKSTLLRRVALDLTGLPPTPDEIDGFLSDTSPDAYERVVDRLLASPHYGERWARPWLDLARYADTNGHEKDNRRTIWKYRDWVIDALNRDLPFDRFTIEQIAGDMLPNASVDQKIASGFHRNAMTNEEGGVDPEESLYEVLVDRANTTATVWLGTTLACAQCHNHKYDPFTQKDYYRLLAFFANTEYDSTTFGDGTRFAEARLDLATAEEEKTRQRLQADIDQADRELKTVTPEVREAQAQWELSMRTAQAAWTPLAPRDVRATSGVVLTTLADGSVLASGDNAALTSYTVTADTTLQGITGLRIETLPDPSLPKGGPGRDAYGHFRVTGLQVEISPANASSDPRQPVAFTTFKVDDAAFAFEPAELLAAAGGGPSDRRRSWAINAMRETDRLPRQGVLAARTPFGFAEGTRITLRIHQLDGTIGQGIGRFRVSATTATDPLLAADFPARLRPVLALSTADRSQAQTDDIAAVFRSTAPLLKPERDALAAARKALTDLQIPSTLVMKERASFDRPSYELRTRGSFTAKGERVYAATPSALHRMREDLPVNRLGLARWLVDEQNPLVARVAVNRLWQQLFGRGLVETSEDFGTQGARPSHPELLDWLATEFTQKGWSQKALLRLIVTSSTYRQSSVVTPALADRDPDNRLLARGPRFRMEAEMVRDVTLAASGLRARRCTGRACSRCSPPASGTCRTAATNGRRARAKISFGAALAMFWRRTSPYPAFMTFDTTSREFCTVRRVRTNTPLQALTLLNDPSSFEAARALAKRMMAAGATPRARAAFGLKLVVSRAAAPAELDRLITLYQSERARYASRPDDAARVIGKPGESGAADVAAWTMVANALLNLDEAVTKE